MRAAVVERYGPPEVVAVRDVAAPTAGRGQVLVRVASAAVSSGDARIRAARFPPGFAVPARIAFGVRRPRRPILGSSFSGTVQAVGDGVDGLAVGDKVAGMAGLRLGAHAELLSVPATGVTHRPAAVDHDQAAGLLFGATTARWFLVDRGALRPGASVLVNGASGAIGTNAVQLARLHGAVVTGVTSAGNAELVRRLGAEHVVDHTTEDVAALDERYDLVLDAVGNLTGTTARRLLRPGGVALLAVAGLGDLLRPRRDVRAGSAKERAEDMAELLALVAAGELEVVLDRCLPLDAVVEAHRAVDSGHKVGNVVVRPTGEGAG